TISATGLASGLAPGTTAISAALDGVTGSTVLTISPAVVQSIVVTPARPSLPKGGTQSFTATGGFSDSSTRDLTSQGTSASADRTVALISPAGVATGLAPGTSRLSAALGGVTGTTVLTVGPAVLQSIALGPANPSVAEGRTVPFTATGVFTDRTAQDLTSQVT